MWSNCFSESKQKNFIKGNYTKSRMNFTTQPSSSTIRTLLYYIKHVYGCTINHEWTPFWQNRWLVHHLRSYGGKEDILWWIYCFSEFFQIKIGYIWSPHTKCSQFFYLRGNIWTVWKSNHGTKKQKRTSIASSCKIQNRGQLKNQKSQRPICTLRHQFFKAKNCIPNHGKQQENDLPRQFYSRKDILQLSCLHSSSSILLDSSDCETWVHTKQSVEGVN